MRWDVVFLGLLVVALVGCTITDANGNQVRLTNAQQGLAAQVALSSTTQLKAVLKGSIYATGEAISLYGACLDANDNPLAGSTALLTSWYPNATQEFVNVSMGPVNSTAGYFIYTGVMSATQGTYLTELECYYGGQVARAFGEWQNPGWVNVLLTRTIELQQSMVNLSLQLNETYVNLSSQMNGQFNQTWQYINYSLMNITWQLTNLNSTMNASLLQQIGAQTQVILDMMTLLCMGLPDTNVSISFNITLQCNSIAEMQAELDSIQIELANITGIVIENNLLLWNLTAQMWNLTANVANISSQINMVLNQTQGLAAAIVSVNNTVISTSNQTWIMIQQLNETIVNNTQNLTTLLYYVAGVANGSVDRNDSYLAILLRGIAVATGAPVTGFLNTTVAADAPVYYKTNRIEAVVINEYGQKTAPPLVICRVNSNTNPPAVNASMQYETTSASQVLRVNGDVVHGGYYFYGEKVTIHGNYTYNVNCSYNPVI